MSKKRLNLTLSKKVMDKVQEMVEEDGTTTSAMLQKLVVMGIFLDEQMNDPNTTIILKRDDTGQELMLPPFSF